MQSGFFVPFAISSTALQPFNGLEIFPIPVKDDLHINLSNQ